MDNNYCFSFLLFFFISFKSTTLVLKSMSDQIIFAPFLANGIALAQYVCEGIMTSSFFNLIIEAIISNADAAELTAKTFGLFMYFAKFFQIIEDIFPVLMDLHAELL